MIILAGDIGGTNSRFALFRKRARKLALLSRHNFVNAEIGGVAGAALTFLAQARKRIDVACFGVAGPVREGKVTLTNLKWTLDEKKLARSLKVQRVALINDLVAHAEGINQLGARDLVTLHRGSPVKFGNRAILAPGTGLGEGGLVYDSRSKDYRAFPSEGGHCDFAPTDDREIALLRFVQNRLGRCSWEDVLSGPGLRNIFDFLISPGKFHVDGATLGASPTPAEISIGALNHSCPAAVAALEMFITFCGSEAGNLALKVLATGGVYIGGGIAPHIVKSLRSPKLRQALINKGPAKIERLLSKIPIHVITSKDGALLGAAHYATRFSSQSD